MILIEAGGLAEATFDAKVFFAAQLAGRGYRVGIDERTLPELLHRKQKYEAARFVIDPKVAGVSQLVMIGAEAVSPDTLEHLRIRQHPPGVRVSAIGRFADHQSLVSARSHLAYALGAEPAMTDLTQLHGQPLLAGTVSPLVATLADQSQPARARPNLMVILPAQMLSDPQTVPLLYALGNDPAYRLLVVLTGTEPGDRGSWLRGPHMFFKHTDLDPASFAALADLVAVFGEGLEDDRIANLLMAAFGAAKPVIDCTAETALVATGAPALQGPDHLAALPGFLTETVLRNLPEISRFMRESVWLERHSLQHLEEALGLVRPGASDMAAVAHPSRTIFIPTNGVGLGHAQRCTLVAAAMKAPKDCAFAAFPSCVPLIREVGFSCTALVQKSAYHTDEYANDLMNYRRLGELVQQGDRLVFDGGYVFDSIYRTILEKQLAAIWIRRGLWQAGQDNSVSLERERIFQKVLVPNEAFEELNQPSAWNLPVQHVGPILRIVTPSGPDLRQRLADQLAHPADELVVSMLGSGVASDRSAQLQALCNMFERRPGCLHLVVVWPGAKVPTSLYGWKNTRVVQTKQAVALCQVADMAISAAGYNSFHEILYHQIPAIFMPQFAPYLDDQERRARAASDRGLAETVLAHELFRLEREVRLFLDEGKAEQIRLSLGAVELPAPGNAAAAACIKGVLPL